jgi:hypothetical protein
MLDPEGLKAVGVATVGQRLSILKSAYLVKLAHNVPIEADHYIPPCKSFFYYHQPMVSFYEQLKSKTDKKA